MVRFRVRVRVSPSSSRVPKANASPDDQLMPLPVSNMDAFPSSSRFKVRCNANEPGMLEGEGVKVRVRG